MSWMQAARQAAKEQKAEIKGANQVAAPPPPAAAPAAETLAKPSVKQPPVRNTISSIHVNYNYFEVGTGQVNPMSNKMMDGVKSQNSDVTFCPEGVSGLPLSGLWASELLRLGFSNRHVPDSPRTGEDWRDLPAANMQEILQHLPSSMALPQF